MASLNLKNRSLGEKSALFASVSPSTKCRSTITHFQVCAKPHAGSVNYDTNQGSDQKEQCVNVMEHYVNAASPCLNIDKSAQRSEAARAHQHPHGISPPVAWLTLHRKCLPFTTHYLLLSPWLLHTGPGSRCPKLPSWADSEHTLAQKMDSRHAKNANQITSVVTDSPIAASILKEYENLGLCETAWLMWIIQRGTSVRSRLRLTSPVMFSIKLY